jgi:ubiquinone biosynthesis protein
LRSELDYTHEARSMDRFREAFAGDETVVFPEVYWDHSTSRVLTMSFVDGVPATKLEEGEVPGVDREQLVQAGVAVYFKMIFDLGFYHADPHAGNLFALSGGRIAFVDFGRTAGVSRRNRDAVFDMLLAVFDDDPRAATEAVLAMTGMPPEVDVARLEVELGRLLALYRRSQNTGGGLEELMQRLLTLVRENHLHLPTELTVLLTTLGMLDGVAAQLDPSFRMVDAAKPFARHMVPQEFGPDRLFKATLRSARAYARFFDDLPVQATRVLRRAGEGEFRISVRPTEYREFMERLQTGFTPLAYALIVSALIIGGAFLVGRVGLSPIEQFGARLVLVAALVSVALLLVRLLRGEYRKWKQARRQTP